MIAEQPVKIKIAQNQLPWQRPSRNRKKRSRSIKFTQIPKKCEICPVDPETVWLKLKNKKLRKVKYTARSASLLSWLKSINYSLPVLVA